jgi:hypothetical protein
MQKMKPAKIINPIDMIGMGVREEYRIDPLDAFTQRLKAQIRRSVNQDTSSVVLYEQGGPCALVPRIIRRADPAAASHHRNARGCSAPQNCNLHVAPFLMPAK